METVQATIIKKGFDLVFINLPVHNVFTIQGLLHMTSEHFLSHLPMFIYH